MLSDYKLICPTFSMKLCNRIHEKIQHHFQVTVASWWMEKVDQSIKFVTKDMSSHENFYTVVLFVIQAFVIQ